MKTPYPTPPLRAGLTRKLASALMLALGLATSIAAQDLIPNSSQLRPGDGKRVLTFRTVASGTWTIPAGVSEVEVLVVGGGGAGARAGAFDSPGGGAGGLYYSTTWSVTPEASVNLAVGAGAPTSTVNGSGASGANSVFGSIIAYGGEGGQVSPTNRGGNQGSHSIDGGSNITAGFLGGTGSGAKGGAGAGQNGRNGDFSSAYGGAGVVVPITGSAVLLDGNGNPMASAVYETQGGYSIIGYAGGGSAGFDGIAMGTQYGESYGGGSGSEPENTAGRPGLNNTGGGGGGGRGANGGGGGSGVVIIAYTEPNLLTHTVSFESNGGSAVNSQVVPDGDSATEPTPPTRTGYTFNGWFSDIALTQNYNFADPVTADITLYAKWTINTYTLTYIAGANGTITGNLSQSVDHGSSGTAVTAVPDSGYLFQKWSDDSLSNPRTDSNVTGDLTITALFVEIPPPFSPDTLATRGDGKTVATFSTVGSGTWTIPEGVSEIEVLVVGGGGAGAKGSAFDSPGGGAGGLYYTTTWSVTSGAPVIVTVGDGAPTTTAGGSGASGQNSVFGNIIAYGGGGGVLGQGPPGRGGNQGGNSIDGGSNVTPGFLGGTGNGAKGGAGAGQNGRNGDFSSAYGGAGVAVPITGSAVLLDSNGDPMTSAGLVSGTPPVSQGYYSVIGYAGGGSAGFDGIAMGTQYGESYGGGSGSEPENTAGSPGLNNTGGGGGGGRGANAGGGGSGVVIVAYSLPTTLTTVELDSDVNPSVQGAPVTFTATVKVNGVTETTATGTFEFTVDDVVVEPAAAIIDGVATYTTSSLTVGGRSIKATYSGDSTYGSSFATMTQTVDAANEDPYDTWAGPSGYNLVGDRDDDDDGDGLDNFNEFAFGLDPTSGASVNPITDISTLQSANIFSYTRLEDSGLTYTVWVSTDLQDWGLVPAAVSEEPGLADANGVQTVVVELTSPPEPPSTKLFIRVKAEEPAPQ